jgi:enoyl-CoA hydratase/carnithine racemase
VIYIHAYSLTIPAGYNATSLKASGKKVYFVNRRFVPIGIDHSEIASRKGNDIRTFNLERTICDVLQNRNQIDIQLYKVAIITGGDKVVFVSGADISESEELIASGNIRDFILCGQGLFRKISECSKLVHAAINGLAIGGGMELAMAWHIWIIADRAKLAQPEINLGIIQGWDGTQMLPKIVGSAKARELILTGESISAQEAFRLNLVNKVVPRKEVLRTAK